MNSIRTFILVCLLTAATSSFAVTLTIGNDLPSPNSSDINGGTVRTDIDLTHPASHIGTVTSVKLYWANPSCANALKIKFFRRVGDKLVLVAERGPFSVTSNAFTALISPAVGVAQGDLIGVTRLTNCGNAGAVVGFPTEGYLQYAGDVSGVLEMSAGNLVNADLVLSGTGNATSQIVAVIPVVGSAAGANGSQFKTEIQAFNPQPVGTAYSTIIYHRAGEAGSISDPTFTLNVAPRVVVSGPDVVASIGQTGLGSIDVIVPVGGTTPQILARVYNDAGALGTSSFTQTPIDITGGGIRSAVLSRGVTGYLIAPRDPVRTRFNVGIRTLVSGASMSVTVRSASGTVLRTKSHRFTATYFTQMDAAAFTGGALVGDESIQISIDAGSAIIYGSTTDNITNDPSIQFVYGAFAIA